VLIREVKGRISSSLFLACLAVLLISCGEHRLRPGESARNRLFAEILRREDHRILGTDEFFPTNLLGSPYPEVREWCAIALGRIGLPRALPWLYEACRVGSAPVRAAAAFAIGEIEDRDQFEETGWPSDPRSITELRRLLDDTSLAVRMRAAEALGKAGSHDEGAEIARRLESFAYDGSPQQNAWLDLCITALIRLKDPVAIPLLLRLASIDDPEVQWRVENALIRLHVKAGLPVFLRLLQSANTDVRTYAAKGVGMCGDPAQARALLPLLSPGYRRDRGVENSNQERIAAVIALGNLRERSSVGTILAALASEPIDNDHPEQENFAIQAATTLGIIGGSQIEPVLAGLLNAPEPVADSAVIALARSMRADPDRFFKLAGESRFKTPPARRAWAQALAELGSPKAIQELKSMLVRAMDHKTDPDGILVLPAIVTSLAKTATPDLQDFILPLLDSRDGTLLRAAIAAFKPAEGARSPWQPIIRAYENIAQGNDLEAKVEVLKGLQPWIRQPQVQALLNLALEDRLRNVRIAAGRLLRLARATPSIPEDPGPSETAASETTYTMLAAARKDRTVAVMKTTRGIIEIELFREDAPMTVANFVSLARQGFFNNLSFMRVVPFFVIQGGDPRNDQEGGPGYAIRCEINLRPFERGSVGIALAGKDTGGSQFFITMAPEPHLDGGYTCFGRILSGMQVIDRIVPGDRIINVNIDEDRTVLGYHSY
jgi:cyclophilin family peptidyl-prolyl cis-trans isomerase/HEAT repeat protein